LNTISNASDLNNILEAILDSERLELIAHLSRKESSLIELSNLSDLPPNDIQRHLDVLECAKLVKARDQDGNLVYRFNPKHLEQVNRQQFARPKNDSNLVSLDLSIEKKKILADYTNEDGSLKMIPTKSKKVIAVLDYLITSFEKDKVYSESQVNDILESYYPDPPTLRRYLIDYGYLGREKNGARYWRLDPQEPDTRKP